MTTSILILLLSVVVIGLLTVLLIRSSQDSDKREMKILGMMERQTESLETIARQQNVTMQTTSSDTADLIQRAIESTNRTMVDLFLGREREISESLERRNEEQEKEPIPGIETLEGLPRNVQEAIQREAAEQEYERTNPVWRIVSAPQPNGSEPISESPWTLENDLPQL